VDEPQDPLVANPVLEELLQPVVIKTGEEICDIRVEHEVHPPPFNPDRQRIERIVGLAPRPESVGEAEKVLLFR
jgi:hypothetical protein